MTRGRKFLFVTWEGGGNVPAVLGVASRLSSRGHEVAVLAEPSIAAEVHAAGARFIPFTRHFNRTSRDQDLIEDWKAPNPLARLKQSFDKLTFGPAGIVAEETAAAMDEVGPDVLVVDFIMLGALLPAQARSIPTAVLFHMPEYLPGPGRPAAGPGFLPRNDLLGRLRDRAMAGVFYRVLGGYLNAFNEVRARYGLAPLRTPQEALGMYHAANRRLIQTSRAFDFPITPAPANVRYVGPILDDPGWVERWTSPWGPDDTRPLVVVSLSSTNQGQGPALQRILDAMRPLDLRVLVTRGPAMKEFELTPPANAILVDSASHAEVFPHASLVISHGGHGTLMRALANGVPVLSLPMGRDQNDNGARVRYHGVGLSLAPTSSPEKIRSAAQRILDDPRYRAAAARLREAILSDVAEGRDVKELEALAELSGAPAEAAVAV